MGVILRIDVDTPYGWQRFVEKAINYLRLNWWFPALTTLGYLHSLDRLLDDLDARNIPAMFFFTRFTTPTNIERYKKYNVGAHIISAQNYTEFQKELEYISNKLHRKISGFTKHGSGKLKLCRTHTPQYELTTYINWAQKAKQQYFLGNGENPEEKGFYVDNVLVYPSAFWINRNYRSQKYTIDWLAEAAKDKTVIVLLHPYNWFINKQIKADYDCLIEKIDNFTTI
jgi:hypothetical protein